MQKGGAAQPSLSKIIIVSHSLHHHRTCVEQFFICQHPQISAILLHRASQWQSGTADNVSINKHLRKKQYDHEDLNSCLGAGKGKRTGIGKNWQWVQKAETEFFRKLLSFPMLPMQHWKITHWTHNTLCVKVLSGSIKQTKALYFMGRLLNILGYW